MSLAYFSKFWLRIELTKMNYCKPTEILVANIFSILVLSDILATINFSIYPLLSDLSNSFKIEKLLRLYLVVNY